MEHRSLDHTIRSLPAIYPEFNQRHYLFKFAFKLQQNDLYRLSHETFKSHVLASSVARRQKLGWSRQSSPAWRIANDECSHANDFSHSVILITCIYYGRRRKMLTRRVFRYAILNWINEFRLWTMDTHTHSSPLQNYIILSLEQRAAPKRTHEWYVWFPLLATVNITK